MAQRLPFKDCEIETQLLVAKQFKEFYSDIKDLTENLLKMNPIVSIYNNGTVRTLKNW